MCFALVAGCTESSSSASGNDICVLLQNERAPLVDVLQMLDEQGFQKTRYPFILVLQLKLLPAKQSFELPNVLFGALGLKLWKNSGGELPSPEEAQNHVIVVLAPTGDDFDPSLEQEPLPALRGGAPAMPFVGNAPDPAKVLETWRDASKNFAVWPGCSFDSQFPQRSMQEIAVNFIPSDQLQSLGVSKPQQLVEWQRQQLTLAFALAPRHSPLNFNACGAWASGVQMVALSLAYGGSDSAVLAHIGRFAQDNGGCGFVRKPPHLCPNTSDDSVEASAHSALRLDLRVLAARAVPNASGLTALSVSIWGSPSDCARQIYRPVRVQGQVITWPEADVSDGKANGPMTFTVAAPSAAIIVIELLELSQGVAAPCRCGFFAAPVDCLRSGLRWVPIWAHVSGGCVEALPTRFGQLSGLLVHVSIKEKERQGRSRRNPAMGNAWDVATPPNIE